MRRMARPASGNLVVLGKPFPMPALLRRQTTRSITQWARIFQGHQYRRPDELRAVRQPLESLAKQPIDFEGDNFLFLLAGHVNLSERIFVLNTRSPPLLHCITGPPKVKGSVQTFGDEALPASTPIKGGDMVGGGSPVDDRPGIEHLVGGGTNDSHPNLGSLR